MHAKRNDTVIRSALFNSLIHLPYLEMSMRNPVERKEVYPM